MQVLVIHLECEIRRFAGSEPQKLLKIAIIINSLLSIIRPLSMHMIEV
jgi:hypothetical protein